MFSIHEFHKKYQTDSSEVVIRSRRFSFFVPMSLDPFIDRDDVFRRFPLWAKIWEASLVLAEHMASLKPDPNRHILEIGSGMGLVGIVASAFGHRVTLTESNPDALNFARANALQNLTPSDPNIAIRKLDWNRPGIKGTFDTITASEVVYSERDFEPLFKLFKHYLKQGGEIVLAEGLRKSSINFFKEMDQHFEMKAQKKIIRTPEKEIRIILCRMRFRT
ncbi:MAG: methyltransferase [Desulfatiglandaceae bacterium]|jgi:predicted nicotinamide N-methyase